MHSILERNRAYRRRLAASLALAVALQLLAWWLLPSPIGPPNGLLPGLRGSSGGGGLSLYDVSLPHAEPAATAPPEPAPTPPAIRPPEPEPTPQAEPEITPAPTPTGPPAPSTVEVAGTGTMGTGSAAGADAGSQGDGADEPGDGGRQVLHPQLWVHPEMPQRALIQRKIDDFVLLQVLVGSDGRVHDVRTLRDISNCEECTRNAVEAAWRLTFDPPVVSEDSVGVWSQIINYRFSYRR